MHLLDLIRKPKPAAADIREALGSDEADIAKAEQRLVALETKRADRILDAPDDELADIEAEIAKASRHVERLMIIKDRAAEALQVAEAREAEELRRRRYDQARKRIPAAEKHLVDYERNALALLETLAGLYRIEAEIFAANSDLPAGFEPLPSVERQTRSDPALREPVPAISSGLTIPAVKMDGAPIWREAGATYYTPSGSGAAETVVQLDHAIDALKSRVRG